ncbi:MAG: hypothetical protein A4E53_01681 [Pelotomaculum sp. PtaB.Bin104]|jgi:outer membrane PBP1 activator LpoA protein|nr:MAG: hypothetical protein A4E53_01681 [Pelotomaculum sp. PtaB.Bin104]
MNKKLLMMIVASVLLVGCSGTVNKSLTVDIKCTNCKTPYGSGDKVEVRLDRTIFAESRNEK